ncbi:tetratricopeptide repeat protein [candidate division KSB1 bacterium]|nr:tetratricopeptide repeat protein [candidate division KSB1 bacterium]
MKNKKLFYFIPVFLITVQFFSSFDCTKKDSGKIPITTSSKEASELYLQGRDLSDRLQAQESLQYFTNAIAADTNFALGYLNLAFVVPNAKDFFTNLNKAVDLADNVSEGERAWILGVQAGVNGEPMLQREYYQKLVQEYPNDERAHNLLGIHYFGLQEWEMAITEFIKATEINPDFSQPYNQLGYAYRFLEQYDKAEEAFKKYIELIPDDPNPYDSYAELLMKTGKFNESIESYQKALTFNPNFVASHIGIATDLNLLGQYEDAREQIYKLYYMARDEGERNAALFTMAVSYADEGNLEKALEEINKSYSANEEINDVAAMAGNLNTMGNILLEMGRVKEAEEKYMQAVDIISKSNLSQEVKDNATRGGLFNMSQAALKDGDIETAKAKADEYRQQVEALNNPNFIRLSHQLTAMIALDEKDYNKAIEELQMANLQNPYNLYRMALAYKGQGDEEKSLEFLKKAANFNGLNNLNYAFIRTKAKNMLEEM